MRIPVLCDGRGRERRASRSPARERKRRRSRSPSTPPRDGSHERNGKDTSRPAKKDRDEEGAQAPLSKPKKPKGSKLFKQPKKGPGGEEGGRGGKASTGSVEFWNDERAKLGLKPLKK